MNGNNVGIGIIGRTLTTLTTLPASPALPAGSVIDRITRRFAQPEPTSGTDDATKSESPAPEETIALPAPVPRGDIQPWDPAEADYQLAFLAEQLAQVRAGCPGKRLPGTLEETTAGSLECIRALIARHAQEAARGWDPMDLLRKHVVATIRCAKGLGYTEGPI